MGDYSSASKKRLPSTDIADDLDSSRVYKLRKLDRIKLKENSTANKPVPYVFEPLDDAVRKALFGNATFAPKKTPNKTSDERQKGALALMGINPTITPLDPKVRKYLFSDTKFKSPLVPVASKSSHKKTPSELRAKSTKESKAKHHLRVPSARSLFQSPIARPTTPLKPSKLPEANNLSNELLEFVKLESNCDSLREESASPVSSMCSLLEKTKLAMSNKKQSTLTNQINNILNAQNNEMEQYKLERQKRSAKISALLESERNAFELFQLQSQDRHKEIRALMSDMQKQGNSSANKENTPRRRSMRLAEKNAVYASPTNSKRTDLRKTALTRSLSAFKGNFTPERKKDLYTSMRQDVCSVLMTPKTEIADSPKSEVIDYRRNLTQIVHKQCLLLQDTPAKK